MEEFADEYGLKKDSVETMDRFFLNELMEARGERLGLRRVLEGKF